MPVPKGTRVGGRKKGTPNKATRERQNGHEEIVAKAAAEGIQPLEYMLKVMRDTGAEEKRRDAMAIAAAAFVHPKKAAVEHSASSENPVTFQIVTGVPRTKEEAKQFQNGHAQPH